DFAYDTNEYAKAMEANVFGKKSADGIKQTSNFLSRIYLFDPNASKFKAFKHFWKISTQEDRPLLTFLFAFTQDHLLFESAEVVQKTPLGDKVSVDAFKENLEQHYPGKYSPVTSHSIGKNLASSWKQAGYIQGKTQNIRVQPDISYKVAAFAFCLAFLEGDRGEFILKNPIVRVLCLNETILRELAIEAARQDLLQYRCGGSVTSFAFAQWLSKLQIFN